LVLNKYSAFLAEILSKDYNNLNLHMARKGSELSWWLAKLQNIFTWAKIHLWVICLRVWEEANKA